MKSNCNSLSCLKKLAACTVALVTFATSSSQGQARFQPHVGNLGQVVHHKPVPIVVPLSRYENTPRAPVPFRPLAMRDPVTHQILQPNDLITLKNGRKISASAYYQQLNEYEKGFNKLGYSLRQHGVFEIGHYVVDYAALDRQANLLRAARKTYVPAVPFQKQLQGISLARYVGTHRLPVKREASSAVHVAINDGILNLPTIAVGPGVQNRIPNATSLDSLGTLNRPLLQALRSAEHIAPLRHDPPASETFPNNLDLGDPSTFAAYFHSSVGFAGDSTGTTFNASADTGGYILGNKVDVIGVGVTLTAPLNVKSSGTAQITATLLGNSITPPAINMSNFAVSYNLIPSSVGKQDIALWSTTIMVGPVPVAVNVDLAMKLTAKLQLEAPQPAEVALQLNPRFRIGVVLELGIGVGGVVSVGVGGELDLVDIQSPITATCALVPGTSSNSGNNPNNLGLYVNLNWTFSYTLLDGKLFLFAQFGPFEARLTLFKWSGVTVGQSTIANVSKWDDLGIAVPQSLDGTTASSLPSGTTPQLATIALQALWGGNSYANGDTIPGGNQVLIQASPFDQFGNYYPCSVQISLASGDGSLNGQNQFIPSANGGAVQFKAVSGNVTSVLNLNITSFYNPVITQVTPNHGLPGNTITLSGYDLVQGAQQLWFGGIAANSATFPPGASSQPISTLQTMTAVIPAQTVTTGGYVAVGFANQNPWQQTFSSALPTLPLFFYYTPDIPVLLAAPLNGYYPAAPSENRMTSVVIPLQIWNAAGHPEVGKTITLTTDSGTFGAVSSSYGGVSTIKNPVKQITVTTDDRGIATATLSNSPSFGGFGQQPLPASSHVTCWNNALPTSKINFMIQFPPYIPPPSHPYQVGQGTTLSVTAGNGTGAQKPRVIVGRFQFLDKKGAPEKGWKIYATAVGGTITSPAVTDLFGYVTLYIHLNSGSNSAKVTVWASADASQTVTETLVLQ